MYEPLKRILVIQDYDIKMMRLMDLKLKYKSELSGIAKIRKELLEKLVVKDGEIKDLNEECILYEQKIEEHKMKIKALEDKQFAIKKVEEFNLLTKEVTNLERERVTLEQSLMVLLEKKSSEEEVHGITESSLQDFDKKNKNVQAEIEDLILQINKEGSVLQKKREEEAALADPKILKIYTNLLYRKKDKVVVPLEGRICTGCHIAITAQYENLVCRGNKIIFCEHCLCIHFISDVDSSRKVGKNKYKYLSM